MGGACSMHGWYNRYITIFVRKPEGENPLVELWRRWEDNIRMDLTEIEWSGFVWLRTGFSGGLL
jgi:hypothetical protein